MSKIYVRSQDKNKIEIAKQIRVEEMTSFNPNNFNHYEEEKVVGAVVTINGIGFGKFKSKERAIEIVNEIFNMLNKCNGIILTPLKEKQIRDNSEEVEQKKKFVASNNELKSFSCDVVYQIPKE